MKNELSDKKGRPLFARVFFFSASYGTERGINGIFRLLGNFHDFTSQFFHVIVVFFRQRLNDDSRFVRIFQRRFNRFVNSSVRENNFISAVCRDHQTASVNAARAG